MRASFFRGQLADCRFLTGRIRCLGGSTSDMQELSESGKQVAREGFWANEPTVTPSTLFVFHNVHRTNRITYGRPMWRIAVCTVQVFHFALM